MESFTTEKRDGGGSSKLFWGIMFVGMLAVAGLLTWYFLQPAPPVQEVRLQNAVREGTPEFEFYKSRVIISENHDFSTKSESMVGGIQMKLVGVVKNFSEKTITGMEVIGIVVDEHGKTVKEKTAIVIPTQAKQLENNKTMPVYVIIDGFKPQDDLANFKLRVSAVKTLE